jgi:outer membrane protein OmpA-like peptidoglycan-associated protein
MKQFIPIVLVALGGIAATGCATKKYVRQQVDPVSGKLDQVATKSDQQGQTLDQTRKSLDETRSTQEQDENKISAANERAVSADNHAGDAMNKANSADQRAAGADQKADQANRGLEDLRGVVNNLDDYKQVASTTVNFKFNSDKLDPDAKMALDQMVGSQNHYKRFFVAVEGFTDRTGTAAYNDALSRRRADAVVEYLVGAHDLPIYRIHMVGLGEQKPVEDARTRAANAKNRRVEVTLFSADQSVALNNAPNAPRDSSGNNH